MRRHPQWRLPLAIAVVACLGLLAAAGAVYASDRWGGSSDAAGAAIPTLVKSGKPVTHTVRKIVKVHVPPRIVHRNGKRIVIPGHTITRRRLVTVPGLATTVPGPTQTVTGPGGVRTVIKTVPGPTTTLPGGTTTLPGSTVTLPGGTTTVAGPPPPPVTVFSTIFSTVTVTETPPPSS